MNAALDYATALERADGDECLLREVTAIFFEEFPAVVARLHRSLEEQDFTVLRKTAHSLKGSLSCLAATGAEEMAAALEIAALAGNSGQARQLVERLEEQVASLHATLICQAMD